jgi:hypothetical protein
MIGYALMPGARPLGVHDLPPIGSRAGSVGVLSYDVDLAV